MAAKNFGRVNVSITASTGGLTAGLSRAGKQMQSFAGTVASTLNPLRMLSSVAQSTFGQLALFSMARSAVNTLTGMASAAAENVDVQSKLSRRLGMTYGELSGLKLAGDLAGVGIESIGAAMTKADVAMQKAAGGSKTAIAAFATLGLSVDQLQGMSGADRFAAIADSISALATPAERATAAVALFGRSGAELLPLFEGGAGSIAAARTEAERLGLALTNAQAQNVEAMNDSFTRVYAAIQGIVQQVTAYLAPAITAIASQFTEFVGSIGGANIGQAIGEALMAGARMLAEIGDSLIAQFGSTFQYLSSVGAFWSSVFSMGGQISSGFAMAGRAVETAFLSVVRAALTPMMFIVEKIADLLSYVPGISDAATQVGETVRGFRSGLDQSIAKSAKQTGENFSAMLDGKAKQSGETLAGPLVTQLNQLEQMAKNAAASVDTSAAKLESTKVQTQVTVNTEALKAIVAGTSEGEAFRNSLIRGADPRNAGNEDQGRTADATEETAAGVDELVSIMRDQFALAEITV